MNDELKKRFSELAKQNGFGGKITVKRICQQCNIEFDGTPNQLRCKKCISLGYIEHCKYCKNEYQSKYKNTKYCSQCVSIGSWLLGKKRDASIGKKISKSKKDFFNIERGKLVAQSVGKQNSIKMKEFNKTEIGKLNILNRAVKQSKIMKLKIANGEFTPPITNSFTHWDAKIIVSEQLTKKFRSSWEACFWFSNQSLKYESVECRTKHLNNRCYIGDFFDENSNILYEIKPKSFYMKQINKIDALIEHCKLNDYKFVWINESNIMDYIDESIFQNEMNKKQLNKLKKGIWGFVK